MSRLAAPRLDVSSSAARIDEALHHAAGQSQHDTGFRDSCRQIARQLGADVERWAADVDHHGFGVIAGLPVGAPPATPTAPPAPALPHADALVGAVTSLFGTLFTFAGKQNPAFIHDVYPRQGFEGSQMGPSQDALEWHVEDGFHPLRPDWVILLCITGDPAISTRLARAADLELTETLHTMARTHEVLLRVDDSFAVAERETVVATRVLEGPQDDPQIVFDPAFTEVDSTATRTVIGAIAAECDQRATSVTLARGEALIFDNRRCVHGRSRYAARFDGTDRWIKRALALRTSRGAVTADGVVPL